MTPDGENIGRTDGIDEQTVQLTEVAKTNVNFSCCHDDRQRDCDGHVHDTML